MRNKFDVLNDIEQIVERSRISRQKRQAFIQQVFGLKKLAFDPRHFDSEEDANPRRNLQHYHNQNVLSEDLAKKLFLVNKLFKVAENIKSEFSQEPEYQDSYAKQLHHLLHRALRMKENDRNYSESQQSLTSISYIADVLFKRYRLTWDEIDKLSTKELKNRVLSIDTDLTRLDPIVNPQEVKLSGSDKKEYKDVLEKVLSAPSDGQKTVTITVVDSKKKDPEKIQEEIKKEILPIEEKMGEFKKNIEEIKESLTSKTEIQKHINKMRSELLKEIQQMIKDSPVKNDMPMDEPEEPIQDDVDDDDRLLEELAELDVMLGKHK